MTASFPILTPFLPPPCLPCFQLTTNQRKQNMRPRSVTQDTLHLVSCLQLPFPHVQIFQSENLIRSSKMWRHGSISEASCPSSVLPRASEFLLQTWFLVQTSCFSRTRNLPYLFLNSQYLSPSMASHIFTKKSWNELKSRTGVHRRKEIRWEISFVNILMTNSSGSGVLSRKWGLKVSSVIENKINQNFREN